MNIKPPNLLQKLKIAVNFIARPTLNASIIQKIRLLYQFLVISRKIECSHLNSEMINIASTLLNIPKHIPGVLVEAGAYKGGCSAKLSLIANLASRRLIVFDSFQGIPQNKFAIIKDDEIGYFKKGQYKGSLSEVKKNVKTYGKIDVCAFKKGWFEQTLPKFKEEIVGGYLDASLPSSYHTCLKHLFPLLQSNCSLFIHDGEFKNIIDLLNSKIFWQNEVGVKRPKIIGLKKQKLLKINKK